MNVDNSMNVNYKELVYVRRFDMENMNELIRIGATRTPLRKTVFSNISYLYFPAEENIDDVMKLQTYHRSFVETNSTVNVLFRPRLHDGKIKLVISDYYLKMLHNISNANTSSYTCHCLFLNSLMNREN